MEQFCKSTLSLLNHELVVRVHSPMNVRRTQQKHIINEFVFTAEVTHVLFLGKISSIIKIAVNSKTVRANVS